MSVIKKIKLLNLNLCSTFRQDFCHEYSVYNAEKCKEIEPYKSQNRLPYLTAFIKRVHDSCDDDVPNSPNCVYTLQEIRSYHQEHLTRFFETLQYKLYLFPAYPGVVTENIIIDRNSSPETIATKRFSFINGIAVPVKWKCTTSCWFLSETPHLFNPVNTWGPHGSRTLACVHVEHDDMKFDVLTTQFGMDLKERLNSARLVSDIIDRLVNPVVLAGDFNSFEEIVGSRRSEQMQILEERMQNISRPTCFFSCAYPGGTFVGMRPVEDEKYCIDLETGIMKCFMDHILCRGFNVTASHIIMPNNPLMGERFSRKFPLTDHCPLSATLFF